MAQKRKKWVRTELSPEYFKPQRAGRRYDEALAPRVTKVFDDGTKVHYRLKRSINTMVSKEHALAEAAVGIELNKIGVVAPNPEKIDGNLVFPRNPVTNHEQDKERLEKRRGSMILYPEIPGKNLKEIMEEGMQKKDISYTSLFRAIGEEDGNIANHAFKTGNIDLVSFENHVEHMFVTPEKKIGRIDVAPLPRLKRALNEKELTKKSALMNLADGLISSAIGAVVKPTWTVAGDETALITKAVNAIIEEYCVGVE